jgi:hypothetical protein
MYIFSKCWEQLPSDAVFYPRGMKTLVTPLQKPKNLHGLFCVDKFLVKVIERTGTRNLKNLTHLNFFYHKLCQTRIHLVASCVLHKNPYSQAGNFCFIAQYFRKYSSYLIIL